jgi:hypothetical protein
MAGLEEQLQALTTALTAASTRENELRTEVVRLGTLPASTATTGPQASGTIDTRSLGKLDHFDGKEKKWEDWGWRATFTRRRSSMGMRWSWSCIIGKWYSRNNRRLWCFKQSSLLSIQARISTVDHYFLKGFNTKTDGWSVDFFLPVKCTSCGSQFPNRTGLLSRRGRMTWFVEGCFLLLLQPGAQHLQQNQHHSHCHCQRHRHLHEQHQQQAPTFRFSRLLLRLLRLILRCRLMLLLVPVADACCNGRGTPMSSSS